MVKLKEPTGWSLGDAESANETWPRTFQIPERRTRWALKPGDTVKLIFLPPEGASVFSSEKMWVEITGVAHFSSAKGPIYSGRLRNHPTQTDIEWDDQVAFEPRHVCSIQEGGGDHAAG